MRTRAFLYPLFLFPFAASAFLACMPALAGPLSAAGNYIIHETFSEPGSGAALPDGWSVLELPRKKKHTHYSVRNEGGNYFLRAESDMGASAIYKKFSADPREFQALSWRWKVENALEGGDERFKAGDDYAARLYVTFEHEREKTRPYDRLKRALARAVYGLEPPGSAICYVWAGGLEKNEALPNPYTEKVMMVAIESGPGLAGAWVREERNVLDDYRELFKAEPPMIDGMVVMTDTDNTKGRAVAYYDDITLRKH